MPYELFFRCEQENSTVRFRDSSRMFLRNSERGNWVGNGGEGAERGVSGQAQRGEAAIQDVGPRSVSEIAVCQRRINNLQTVKSL
jgi:hypothetical protein